MNAVTTEKKRRFGCFKIRIGSNHMIKNSDGIVRQFQVQDLSRHKVEEGALPPIVVCLYCKKTYETEAELLAAHPDNRFLIKQEEAHIYGWWTETTNKKNGISATLFSNED